MNKITFMIKPIPLLALLMLFVVSGTAANTVHYSGVDRNVYTIKVLKHALSYHPDSKYQVEAFGQDLPKFREFEIMSANEGIDVITGGATLERVKLYQAVPFPLLKGLHGWRIPLINKHQHDIFESVQTIAQFKQFVAGQFHTWSDTKVLESNGIVVRKGTDVEGLYGMLDKGRFDYFPRSVLEVKSDYAAKQHLNIAIDKNIIIHYPTAYYFYVAKDNDQLAADILFGLESAQADGSFDKMFMEDYGAVIREAIEASRTVLHLENPFLPNSTATQRAELWIDLENAQHPRR